MANFPSRTDIVTAMRNPQTSFKSSELIGGNVIQKGSRVVQYSGGYTTVFPFNTKNLKKVAVRCWIADIGDAKRRSQEISAYLDNLCHPYFAGFKYIENALLVNGNMHAVVVMDWVKGKTLKAYIDDNVSAPHTIIAIANKFKEMVEYFHKQNIAHGDLQHGNILVKDDGSLVAIDYDSMYISPLTGMPDVIKGLPGYQHPARGKNQLLNPKLDYFSELVIYLSLLIYAEEPHLWGEYYETEDLLFSKEDFENPDKSLLITKFCNSPNAAIANLSAKLKEELLVKDISELRPLEELMINKLDVAKDSIFDKWDMQPNPPTIKAPIVPSLSSIIDKF
ncbi:protein kinase domain-containing protein [Rufibacter radiotolerans]|uniref:protein kinase domain-containing protein n=1 Tax=Rufibacter radiotolerans TaxID=1379910 RepID=UPI0009E40261|nr:AarF/UbiB family protein [Rufibacter radiotolerans]